jgi:hypothetical protein
MVLLFEFLVSINKYHSILLFPLLISLIKVRLLFTCNIILVILFGIVIIILMIKNNILVSYCILFFIILLLTLNLIVLFNQAQPFFT